MLFIIRDWSISVHPLYYVVPANGHAKYDYTAGILHTIFFHRTLSLVRPKDVDCDFLEITYVSISLYLDLDSLHFLKACDAVVLQVIFI